ncbi:putative tubulin polyglutamylase TTLL9 [Saccoglossus kowalevskii]|uniref:Tubulin--tyrosine ligase-like protein 9 n=1 Tax=Saccoglossus kowalevskii TaxID=10224 RepID=A0ABM0M2S0_SACKO|nr:PREDICTED: probable tubulin polyglutamylase TTLL9-like [Saccoglossus kowalevskii]
MYKNSKNPLYSRPDRKRGIGDRVIRFKCGLQNTIYDVLKAKGWQEVRDEGDWDFFWADVGWMREYFDHCYLEEHVKINHFRNHYELTRKNLMVKNLKRFRKQLERESGKLEASKCDFFPTSFELPSEYHIFVEEFKRNPGTIWIMKPVAKSQGKGIFLFRKLKDITDWKKVVKNDTYTRRDDKQEEKEAPETYIVQRYLDRPYLIGGKKFDIRVYVMVTSYIPLKAWIYRSGFARFSNSRFSLDSIDDTYIHLTNVAVQKTAPDYDPEKGCKWSMQQLRQYLIAKHGIENVENLFRLMDDIFIKSLQSVQKIMINDKHCFELYGYDILIDQDIKPWLIEVNASPSLTASNEQDYNLKLGLLEDVIHVLDLENKLTGKEKRVGGFDLMWNDGPVVADEGGVDCISTPTYSTNTFLGCHNDRKKQLYTQLKQVQATKKP